MMVIFEVREKNGSQGDPARYCTEYNEFDFFLENKEYRPFDECKIEI
jgi:hypothetical protein